MALCTIEYGPHSGVTIVVWVEVLSIVPLPTYILLVLINRSLVESSVLPSSLLPARIELAGKWGSRRLPEDPVVFRNCVSTWRYPSLVVCANFHCPVPTIWPCVVVVVQLALEQLPPLAAPRLFFRHWMANPAPSHIHNLCN